MTTRSRKSAEERKSEIVDTAIRLAADIGPDQLTTEKLAREIGISQAAIFRHFPTKGDIWSGVAQRIGKMLKADTAHDDNADIVPVEQLRKLVIRQLGFIKKTPAIPAILFSRELHSKNDEMRKFFVAMMEKRQKLFAGLIAREIDNGSFDQSLNASDAAWLILSLIQGLAMRWSLNARDFDLVEEGERLLDILLAGFEAA